MHDLRARDILRITYKGEASIVVCVCSYNLWFFRVVDAAPWEPHMELAEIDAPWITAKRWLELNKLYVYDRITINSAFDGGGFIGQLPYHLVGGLISAMARAETIEPKRQKYIAEQLGGHEPTDA